ncbi:MAG: hypothetical protein JJE04_13185 [Acidobacteriia bacterium]|nr:hypothetical protein [Terriglobia bacterium]
MLALRLFLVGASALFLSGQSLVPPLQGSDNQYELGLKTGAPVRGRLAAQPLLVIVTEGELVKIHRISAPDLRLIDRATLKFHDEAMGYWFPLKDADMGSLLPLIEKTEKVTHPQLRWMGFSTSSAEAATLMKAKSFAAGWRLFASAPLKFVTSSGKSVSVTTSEIVSLKPTVVRVP